MKKLLTLSCTLVLLLGLCCGLAFAAGDKATVFVTIADKDGNLALATELIDVTDIDNDGKLTVNDALYCAHEAKFTGGAAAGYLSEMTEYGLSLKKLWGIDNGTGYGYYVNNAAAMSLGDEIKNNDYINAFVYTDTTNWSDTYCFFDAQAVAFTAGSEIPLKLSAVGFDANYNTVISPVEGATILVDGKATDAKTDKDGKVTVSIKDAGLHIISAKSDSVILVPPACSANISAAEEKPVDQGKEEKPQDTTPKTGDTATILLYAIAAMAALGTVIVVSLKKEKAA